MTLVEAIATLFGVAAVWLTIRRNALCWPVGLVQVVLYIYIFYGARLYSDVILHIIYVFLQFYGWYRWRASDARMPELHVSQATAGVLTGCLVTVVLGTATWGYLMDTYTQAAAAYVDAFVAVCSLTATWLLARKKLESWLFWIAVDVVAIGLYLYKELFITCGLYALFLAMAIGGFFAWRRSMRNATSAMAPVA